MASTNKILWRYFADTKSLERGNKVAQSGFKATNRAGEMLRSGVATLGVAFGVRGLARQIGSAISRAEEMDSKYAITKKIIEDTGGAAHVTAGHVKDMSAEMAMTTGIDKAVVTDAANVMLTFAEVKNVAGDMNDVFDRSVELTADMATVFGGSASDAAKQLGKALNDPISGVTALSRTGVQFTKQQRDQIKVLQESGDMLGAQKLILEELDSQVGGTAAASADATAIMARGWDEVTETLGNGLLPIIKDVAPAVVDMSKKSVNGLNDFSRGISVTHRWLAKFSDALPGADNAWSDAQEEVYQLDRHILSLGDSMQNGTVSTPLLTQELTYLAQEGLASADNIGELQESLAITDDEMRTAQIVANDMGLAYGTTAEDAAILNAAMLELTGWTVEQAKVWQEVAPAYLEMAAGVKGIGDAAVVSERQMRSMADYGKIFAGAMFEVAESLAAANRESVGMLFAGGGGSGQTADPVSTSQAWNDTIAIGSQTGG